MTYHSKSISASRDGPKDQNESFLTIIKRVFELPRPFLKFKEQDFLRTYSEESANYRRAALILALSFWTAFYGWDLYHGLHNPSFASSLYPILLLRTAGVIITAVCLLLFIRTQKTSEHTTSSLLFCTGTASYFLLLAMTRASPFPFDYLFYFPGLLMVIFFVAALLRLRARPYLIFACISLVGSGISLSMNKVIDTKFGPLEALGSYYFVSAISFLFAFLLIGFAVCAELERSARSSYARGKLLETSRHDLAQSNDDLKETNEALINAQRETSSRTASIIALKEEMRNVAEHQSASKSRFIADAAHDLRQPLQAMANFLEAASVSLEAGDFDRCHEMLAFCAKARLMTTSLFGSILDLSQLDSGHISPKYDIFDINDLISGIISNVLFAAEKDGVHVYSRLTSRQAFVRSDRLLLTRAVMNLVGNSIKYRETARSPNCRVLIATVAIGERLRIDILDNGLGIAKNKWEAIFQPFAQLNNPGRDRDKGVGLGLSIVKASVALLEGHRLDMNSVEDRGSRFSLEVPLTEPPVGMGPFFKDEFTVGYELTDIYVLYVEDDSIVRQSTIAVLQMAGVLVDSFGGIEETKTFLSKLERVPDIIITDYGLLDGNGLEIIGLVEETCEMHIPSIIISGQVGTFTAPPNVHVLEKPVDPAALFSKISAVMRDRDWLRDDNPTTGDLDD